MKSQPMEVRLTLMEVRWGDGGDGGGDGGWRWGWPWCWRGSMTPAPSCISSPPQIGASAPVRTCLVLILNHDRCCSLQNLANQISFLLVVNVCQPFEEKQPCPPLEPAGLWWEGDLALVGLVGGLLDSRPHQPSHLGRKFQVWFKTREHISCHSVPLSMERITLILTLNPLHHSCFDPSPSDPGCPGHPDLRHPDQHLPHLLNPVRGGELDFQAGTSWEK